MNVGSVFSEIGTAFKAGESDLLAQVGTMATNLSKSTNKTQLIVEGAVLLDTVAKNFPDPKVQMIAGLAGAVLAEAQAMLNAKPAT